MDGPLLLGVKIQAGRSPTRIATKSGDELKARFRRALLGAR